MVTALLRWLFALVLFAIVLVSPETRADPALPEWIWSKEGDRFADGSWSSKQTLSLPKDPSGALLRVTADFAGLRVRVNGREILALDPYDPPAEVEAAGAFHAGGNTLELEAKGLAHALGVIHWHRPPRANQPRGDQAIAANAMVNSSGGWTRPRRIT